MKFKDVPYFLKCVKNISRSSQLLLLNKGLILISGLHKLKVRGGMNEKTEEEEYQKEEWETDLNKKLKKKTEKKKEKKLEGFKKKVG